jgi:uncharacterized protein YuzE
MKSNYDNISNTLTINWGDGVIYLSKEIEPCVILDYDFAGNVIGIEILNASLNINY